MSQINNKQIAINTIFLYIRMMVVMVIGLYTVRAYLFILGETDYGIYNVVGGVVSMFTFLNGTLATSSQRYFSQALVDDDKSKVNRVFCLNLTIYVVLIAAIFVVLETVGLWFLNAKLTIPEERLTAANVVYQLSVLTFAFQMFSIPYNALIISREKMKAFAYIGILEAVLKLGFVFVLVQIAYDKLISYAVFMLFLYLLIAILYIYYCHRNFEESHFKLYWNRQEALEMLSFSGWHLFGTFSVSIRSHGINILLNMFFNPAVNAARAVAFQVYTAVSQLSNNFFTAVKPQIYKSYSTDDKDGLFKLIIRSTILCTLLVSILAFPILANTPYVLGLWLEDIPDKTIIFTQLVLINGIIDSTSNPTIAAALATGKIKKYQEIVASLIFLNLPISYVALKIGASPEVTMIISILLSYITSLVRAYLLQSMIGFSFRSYLILFIKLSLVSVFIWCFMYNSIYNHANSLISLLFTSFVIDVIILGIYLLVFFEKSDIYKILKLFKTVLR